MKRRLDYKELQKKFEVSVFIPPDYAMELAHERTRGMLRYFFEVIRFAHWCRVEEYLSQLISSAYLQGVEDGAAVAARMVQTTGSLPTP